MDLDTFLAELAVWAEERDPGFETVPYGDHPDQVADVRRGGARNAIVVHGGFWRPAFTRANTRALAVDLALNGWTTWNVEYRRTGLADMLDDISALLDVTGRGVAVGHSAGGHLALWAAGTGKIDKAVSLAGVTDLARGGTRGHRLRRGRRARRPGSARARRPHAPPASRRSRPAGARDRGRPRAVRLQQHVRVGLGSGAPDAARRRALRADRPAHAGMGADLRTL